MVTFKKGKYYRYVDAGPRKYVCYVKALEDQQPEETWCEYSWMYMKPVKRKIMSWASKNYVKVSEEEYIIYLMSGEDH